MQDGAPVIQLEKRVEFEWLHTQASATARCAPPTCTFSLQLDELMINDPRLAPSTMPVTTLALDGTYGLDDHHLQGSGRLGGLRFDIEGSAAAEPMSFDVEIDVKDAPLGALVELFGPLVPEGRRGELRGTIGLNLKLSGLPLR